MVSLRSSSTTVPFNLMKSEQRAWVIQGVDYPGDGGAPGVPRRLLRPQHPGCPRPILPAQHRPQPAQRLGGDSPRRHRDAGPHDQAHLLRRKTEEFRVRYDKIVAFEPFSDGFGIMRDAQTAKPQTFRTGDGWFPYNLVTNLAQTQG